jgi:peptide/nickel transport system permease protein
VWHYLARRFAQGVVVVFLVVTATFVLIRVAPGDPFAGSLDGPTVPADVRQAWRDRYCFDCPMLEQYGLYLSRVAQADLGWSTSQRRPVRDVLADAMPNTMILMLVALAASFIVGIAVGVYQAVRRGRAADRVLGAITLFFFSMPDFWLALMMMLTFAYWIPVFPVTGMVDATLHRFMSPGRQVVDILHHLVLPASTLTLLLGAVIARYQRSAMLDVAHDDYVRTARAKGVAERVITSRHALRNALLPVITLFGLAFPALLGGAVLVERVFSWPGMGLVTLGAIHARDYHLVTASVIVGSAMVVAGSLTADLLYAVADPRLRRR